MLNNSNNNNNNNIIITYQSINQEDPEIKGQVGNEKIIEKEIMIKIDEF